MWNRTYAELVRDGSEQRDTWDVGDHESASRWVSRGIGSESALVVHSVTEGKDIVKSKTHGHSREIIGDVVDSKGGIANSPKSGLLGSAKVSRALRD